MSQLPESTSPLLPVSPVRPAAPGPVAVVAPETRAAAVVETYPRSPQRIPRWLERAELFVRVMLKIWVGVFVCIFPWVRAIWDEFPLFVQHPALASFAAHGAVRGLVSGIGLLNLWFAFRDALGKGSDADSKS